MTHQGFSPRLQTARDLLSKLTRDFERIQNDPRDEYAAFDFFVTAEHMGEWPPFTDENSLGHRGPREKGVSRKGEVPHEADATGLLLLVCHLATGAKHFKRESQRLQSDVAVDDRPGDFDPAYFDVGGLVVRHDGLGSRPSGSIAVDDLAREVLRFWQHLLG